MGSLADGLRKDLEARGEYVVMANASTSWFAVFPTTWRHRAEEAMRDGREGPSLVVYKTRSDDERDHYIIPYSVIRGLLVEDTLTTSEVNGSQRWNFTLKNGELHVSHRAGTVDVSQYHGVRLLAEEVGSSMAETVAADETRLDDMRIPVVGAVPSNEAPEDPSAAIQAVHQQLITEQEQQLIATGVFDPGNVRDARERIMASIVRRRGQPAFRRQLLRAYKGKCAISGCGVEATLDAAHIVPYKGPETNHPANGLLLRTDLHTLFDLGLIAIETETMRVLVAPSLTGSCYQEYAGKRLCLPSDPMSCPSREALDEHRASSSIPKGT